MVGFLFYGGTMKQIPIKTTCNACNGECYLPTGQTYTLCGREHKQLARCTACDGKGTLLYWVDVQQLAIMLFAIGAEE
jgi:hypothetical protein